MVWFLKLFFWSDFGKFSWLAWLFKHFFMKIQPNMREQEKKQQKIYDLLNAETKPKNFQNNWTLTPLIMLHIGRFRKQKKMQLLIQILICLRLLLRRNGIKCLKNFILKTCKSFQKHVDTIIERKWWPYWINLLICVYLLIFLFFFN